MSEFQAKLTDTSRLCVEERPGPCTLVIFGASGDLAKRKLVPALYNLHKRDLLPEKFDVARGRVAGQPVGVAAGKKDR